MAKRPWAAPEDIRKYTDNKKVKARNIGKLTTDITRAEQYIISYTNNHFDDEKYPEIPEPVKTAVILIAETYAMRAVESKGTLKSETFDDYSYTVADTAKTLENLDLGPLLDDYVISQPRGGVNMKLRKL